MKRKFLVILTTIFALAAIGLIAMQFVQTRRSSAISDNLFNISVSNAMDNVVDQLNRLKIEDYIGQNDRYKLLKFKRVEDFNTKISTLVQENGTLFIDTNKVAVSKLLIDSVAIIPGAVLTSEDSGVVRRYNTLIGNRNKLTKGNDFYDQIVNDLSGYMVYDMLSSPSFNYKLLDSMIVEQLAENGVDVRPKVGIWNSADNKFMYTSNNSKEDDLLESPYRYSVHPNGAIVADDYYILLQFPRFAIYFQEHSNIYLMMSVVLTLIIIALFVISVRSSMTQRKLNEMKTDFISNMTHEIKTPIATIGLACEMLRDPSISESEESRKQFVGIINDENRRMRVLVETILQSAKMSNKNFSMNKKEVDTHKVIMGVIGSFGLAIKNRNGEIRTELNADPSTLYADELHITNLVYNLVDNAIKYSPEKISITIRTQNEGKDFLLSIADEGAGISAEDQKHIFEKFYRVNTGNVHDVKGFGIGLNYVSQVVQLHHGKISVQSELGKGSCFEVRIPRIE